MRGGRISTYARPFRQCISVIGRIPHGTATRIMANLFELRVRPELNEFVCVCVCVQRVAAIAAANGMILTKCLYLTVPT